MQKITPFLWFNQNAEEAAKFYVSVFKDAKILQVTRYGKAGPGPDGAAMTVKFRLLGQEFTGLNGGPNYKFTHAVSFVVHCKTQKKVDHYWSKLKRGGKEVQCGWLTDKYGLSWQIVPTALLDLIGDKDPEKVARVMKAMFGMIKLDIKRLQAAARAKK